MNLTVNAVNDAPVVTAPGSAYGFTEAGSLTIHGTGFSVNDVDDSGGTMTATFTVGEGRLLIDAGDSGVTLSGNNTATVTLTGTGGGAERIDWRQQHRNHRILPR